MISQHFGIFDHISNYILYCTNTKQWWIWFHKRRVELHQLHFFSLSLFQFYKVKRVFCRPRGQTVCAFWPISCNPLCARPYHPGMIGGWSQRATFTVQMLSFQWHFKQSLSIYSHSRFMSFDKNASIAKQGHCNVCIRGTFFFIIIVISFFL